MRIVKPSRIRQFCRRHPDAERALLAWLGVARRADWHNLAELRRTYPHADPVRVASGQQVTVFNIRAGHYRLIVSIKYQWSMIYVLRFLSHAEYDRDRWKDEL